MIGNLFELKLMFLLNGTIELELVNLTLAGDCIYLDNNKEKETDNQNS